MLKRAFDLLAAAAGLLLLAPLLLAIAAAVKACDRGPVFFRQTRVGRGGRPFRIWKFRTMRPDAERIGPGVTAAGDARITGVGAFLRRRKLDELPQLLNVLSGDMSLVGPRPEIERYVTLYNERQRGVLGVRPGITDPATLLYRDEEDLLAASPDSERFYREVCMPAKLAINLEYIPKATLLSDMGVLIRTVLAIVGRRPRAEVRGGGWIPPWVLVGAGGVLAAGVAMMLLQPPAVSARDVPFLGRMLPPRAEGWQVEDQPLAATEGDLQVVQQKLDYDDYVFRKYGREGSFFDVYAAYWAPAKLPSSMVAAHTPDICWVSGGWVRRESRSAVRLPLSEGGTIPGEWRVFTASGGVKRYVIFWHVGGELAGETYGRGQTGWSYVKARLRDLGAGLFTRQSEQFFIRISSDRPFESWQSEPLFRSIMDTLGGIVLQDHTVGTRSPVLPSK